MYYNEKKAPVEELLSYIITKNYFFLDTFIFKTSTISENEMAKYK